MGNRILSAIEKEALTSPYAGHSEHHPLPHAVTLYSLFCVFAACRVIEAAPSCPGTDYLLIDVNRKGCDESDCTLKAWHNFRTLTIVPYFARYHHGKEAYGNQKTGNR